MVQGKQRIVKTIRGFQFLPPRWNVPLVVLLCERLWHMLIINTYLKRIATKVVETVNWVTEILNEAHFWGKYEIAKVRQRETDIYIFKALVAAAESY